MPTDPADAESLRIWHIAESYPPTYGGGAAIVVRDICQALAKMGHEIRVLATEQWEGEPYSVREDRDGEVLVRRVNLPYFRSYDPEGWQLGLRKWRRHERRIADLIDAEIDAWRPDLVAYSTTRPFGEEGILTLARRDLPICALLHDAWLICPRVMLHRSPTDTACSGPGPVKCLECMYSHYDGSHLKATLKLSWRVPRLGVYPAYRLWRRRAARHRIASAVGHSEFMVGVHEPHLGGPAMIVPLGINLAGLPDHHPDRPRSPLRFGFMAGFQPTKGIWDVLDAAEALKAEGLDFEVHIWGPGQEGGPAELAGRDLGDRVHLRGMYDDVWNAYDEIDVAIVATTVVEPFGRIPIEAAAAGAPTIAPRIGGIEDSIRHDSNGLLYDFKDAADLQRQMHRVLTEPGLFARLSDALTPPVDTRLRGAAVEQAYRAALRST